MFKLTLPEVPDFYMPLIKDKRVARVVALSGGYTRAEACKRLAANHGMIASFSRALAQDLRRSMSDAEFNGALEEFDRRDLSSIDREGLTARALEIGEIAGAFASLGTSLSGSSLAADCSEHL